MTEKDRERVLILAKSLDFSWPTTMALLFLGALNYRITAGDLERLNLDFHRLNVKTCLGGHSCVSIAKGGGRQRTISAILRAPLIRSNFPCLEARVRAYEWMQSARSVPLLV